MTKGAWALARPLLPAPGEEPVPFEAAVNRCPDPMLRVEHRLDPYWAPIWAGGAQASWASQGRIDRLVASGDLRATKHDGAWRRDEARRVLIRPEHPGVAAVRSATLAVLGAVYQHRTLTAEQVATVTGQPVGRALELGFGAGLVERGTLLVELGRQAEVTETPGLYRPGRTRKGWLLGSLSYAEWVAMTGGRRLTFGSQYDRHNLCCSEFLLRMAELAPAVAAVTGELLSGIDRLVGRPPGYEYDEEKPPGPTMSSQAADGLIVRSDGLRIAIEVTNSVNVQTTEKIRRWVERLSNTGSVDEGGLVVLFLDVGRPDKYLLAALRRAVARTLDHAPPSSGSTSASPLPAGPTCSQRRSWSAWTP